MWTNLVQGRRSNTPPRSDDWNYSTHRTQQASMPLGNYAGFPVHSTLEFSRKCRELGSLTEWPAFVTPLRLLILILSPDTLDPWLFLAYCVLLIAVLLRYFFKPCNHVIDATLGRAYPMPPLSYTILVYILTTLVQLLWKHHYCIFQRWLENKNQSHRSRAISLNLESIAYNFLLKVSSHNFGRIPPAFLLAPLIHRSSYLPLLAFW